MFWRLVTRTRRLLDETFPPEYTMYLPLKSPTCSVNLPVMGPVCAEVSTSCTRFDGATFSERDLDASAEESVRL